MYEREDIGGLVKLLERGDFKLGESTGHKISGKFALEDWDKAFTAAEENNGWGISALIEPSGRLK